MKKPPKVSVRWCPECGRTDRYTTLPFAPRKHFHPGFICAGEPVTVIYKKGEVAP